MRALTVAWIGLALAGTVQAAGRVEGEFVEGTTSGLILLRRGGRSEVVALERGGSLLGLSALGELRAGDRILYEPVRAAPGVRWIRSLERVPEVSVAPEFLVDLGELLRLVAGRAEARPALLDLRSGDAFARGHLPGARSAEAWRTRLGALLPKDPAAAVVIYGESRQDASVPEALRAALRSGHGNVRAYLGGYREWADQNQATWVRAVDLVPRLRSEPVAFLDLRPAKEVGGRSLPRSVAVEPTSLRSQDWVDRPTMPTLVLVGRGADDPAPIEVAERIRLWQPSSGSIPPGSIQILEGGFESWAAAGGPMAAPTHSLDDLPCVPLPGEICPSEFLRLWGAAPANGAPLLLDVRSSPRSFRPAWALHLPIADLPTRLDELPRDREIVVLCSRGYTSRVAQALLTNAGFRARFSRLPAPGSP